MSLIKCPKCGSSNLSAEKKGFSGKKAVAGALLTGGIGLLAGTIGSNDTMVTCLKCGYRFKAGQAVVRQVDEDNKPIIDDKKIRNVIAGKGRMQAIKYCHENLGMDSEWAKDHVDHIIKDQGLKPLSATEGIDNDSAGCFAVIVIAILLIVVIIVAIAH